MSNKLKSKTKQNKVSVPTNRVQFTNIWVIPIFVMILLVPLIVHERKVVTHLSQYVWYSKNPDSIDMFLRIKSEIFLVLSAILVVMILFGIYDSYKHKSKPSIDHHRLQFISIFCSQKCLIPLAVYMIWIIISTVCSDYTNYALRGSVEQYESMWVLLGYGLIVYYLCIFISRFSQIKLLVKVITITVVCVVFIGLTQLFGHDFFQTKLGHSLISSRPLKFNFGKGYVYSTLFNPNYVGVFGALMIPILFGLILYSKGYIKKMCYGVLTIGLLLVTYGSKSFSGLVGAGIGLLALLLIYGIKAYPLWKKHRRLVGISILVIALIGISCNFALGNPIGQKITSQISAFSNDNNVPSCLSKIVTNDDNVLVTYRGNDLKIQLTKADDSYLFKFQDANGQVLDSKLSEDQSNIVITDERFSNITFSIVNFNECICFNMYVEGHAWFFTNQTDGTYYFVNQFGRRMHLDQSQQFKSYWHFGSGRGYIWDRSMSILKKHCVFGTGPDTYVLYFPNSEYLNLYHTGFTSTGNGFQLITKPHSLYLQIATQTGIPALLAFLLFYCFYVMSSLKLYRKRSIQDKEVLLSIIILCGTIGYMVTGLANDSTVAVSPLFWTLIGLGLSINQIIKKHV